MFDEGSLQIGCKTTYWRTTKHTSGSHTPMIVQGLVSLIYLQCLGKQIAQSRSAVPILKPTPLARFTLNAQSKPILVSCISGVGLRLRTAHLLCAVYLSKRCKQNKVTRFCLRCATSQSGSERFQYTGNHWMSLHPRTVKKIGTLCGFGTEVGEITTDVRWKQVVSNTLLSFAHLLFVNL